MNIKLELLQYHICDLIKTTINDNIIDPSKIADTTAISILDEIKSIVIPAFGGACGNVNYSVIAEKYHDIMENSCR